MGLSIHYSLEFSGTEDAAKDFVLRLQDAAVNFNAGEVTPVLEMSDEHPILNMTASSWVFTGGSQHPVVALKFFGFVLEAGEGCEPVAMGLAQVPATINVEGLDVDTELGNGWHWVQHIKTQYASNPKYGGIQNFLQCHLTICALLEKAKDFGAKVIVDDESGFWEHRSVDKLVESVTHLNQIMAGMLGAMKDAESGDKVSGTIQDFTNFERLEAEAMTNPELAASLKQAAEGIKKQL